MEHEEMALGKEFELMIPLLIANILPHNELKRQPALGRRSRKTRAAI
jgi:hypothetical protein